MILVLLDWFQGVHLQPLLGDVEHCVDARLQQLSSLLHLQSCVAYLILKLHFICYFNKIHLCFTRGVVLCCGKLSQWNFCAFITICYTVSSITAHQLQSIS